MREAAGAPVVYTVHSLDRAELELGGEPASWRFHGPVQEEAIRGSDLIVCISRSEAGLVRRYYPAWENRVRVVPHGIDPGPWGSCGRSVRRRSESPLVLFVGRLDRRKGIHDLLASWEAVSDRFPSARLAIVGDDHTGAPTCLAARWLAPSTAVGSIHFCGWAGRNELARWYRRADILVVPSRYEPFGMVVLEGMLHGLAVVASATGGPSEILVDGETSILFPPGDAEALTLALLELLDDPELRARLGAAAAKHARLHWGWSGRLEQMGRVYEEARSA